MHRFACALLSAAALAAASFGQDVSVLWTRAYSMTGHSVVMKYIQRDSAGDFYVVGSSDNGVIMAVKINYNGVAYWSKLLTNTAQQHPVGIALTTNGRLFIAASKSDTGTGASLYALDGATGAQLSRVDRSGQYGASAFLASDGPNIFWGVAKVDILADGNSEDMEVNLLRQATPGTVTATRIMPTPANYRVSQAVGRPTTGGFVMLLGRPAEEGLVSDPRAFTNTLFAYDANLNELTRSMVGGISRLIPDSDGLGILGCGDAGHSSVLSDDGYVLLREKLDGSLSRRNITTSDLEPTALTLLTVSDLIRIPGGFLFGGLRTTNSDLGGFIEYRRDDQSRVFSASHYFTTAARALGHDGAQAFWALSDRTPSYAYAGSLVDGQVFGSYSNTTDGIVLSSLVSTPEGDIVAVGQNSTQGVVRRFRHTGIKSVTIPANATAGGNCSCSLTVFKASPFARAVLFSGAPGIINPIQVPIAAGAVSASFVCGLASGAAFGPTRLTLHLGNQSFESGPITVAAGGLQSLVVAPASVVGGNSATGTVTFAKPAAFSSTVGLSVNGANVNIPASVTLAPTDTTGTFSVGTTAVAATVTRTVTAQIGASVKTDTITITP